MTVVRYQNTSLSEIDLTGIEQDLSCFPDHLFANSPSEERMDENLTILFFLLFIYIYAFLLTLSKKSCDEQSFASF